MPIISENRSVGYGGRFIKHRAGFTLLEVLISVAILAIGVVGVAGLQALSVNTQVESRNMDSAINLAYDALDRMQANSKNITDYLNGSYSSSFVVSASSSPPSSGAQAIADYNALLAQMQYMSFGTATLSVSVQNNIPYTGVDTATATISWSRKGKVEQCQASMVIYKK